MTNLKDMVKIALQEEANLAFGMVDAAPMFTQGTTELVEKKKEKEESSEKSEETSESSTPECSDKTSLTEEEVLDIKLSARSLRSLVVASIAESMVNESIDEDEDLVAHGLLLEGKMTEKGKEMLKKFLPTLFAS